MIFDKSFNEIIIKRVKDINKENCGIDNFDGYKITCEQILKINEGDKEAVDLFFIENSRRLVRLGFFFLRYYHMLGNKFVKKIIELDDCLNQLYVDMRSGYLKFALVRGLISKTICHSFRYCGVGGFGDEDGFYYHSSLFGGVK